MFTTTAFAALVVVQGASFSEPLPMNAEFMYSGIPGIVGSHSRVVRMTWHDVDCRLTKRSATVTSVTAFHNDSRRTVRVRLKLPVDAVNLDLAQRQGIRFTVTLDGVPLKTGATNGDPMPPAIAFDPPERSVRYRSANALFRGRRTHVLRVVYSVPVGKGGLAGMEHMIGYETAGASSWRSPLHEINFALHYSPNVVFHVNTAEPDVPWQVGDTGAYFKRVSRKLDGDTLIRFMYYRGGFDMIGE